MKLLTLVLMLMFCSGCFSEVVNSFIQQCSDFFVNANGVLSPPTVFKESNYKQICQIRDEIYEYATLYDTANKIPVYSAYKFEGRKGCTRYDNWYVEPQLEDRRADEKMAKETGNTLPLNQASNTDYKDSGYDRGHLAAAFHASSQSCSDATFTLSNAAPQNPNFNQVQWKATENAVAMALEENCEGNFGYIVTGVVPSGNTINNRVRVPSHVWTAYCCIDNNHKVKNSRGFLGENKAYHTVTEMSIFELDKNLTKLYNKAFKVFGGMCYMTTQDRFLFTWTTILILGVIGGFTFVIRKYFRSEITEFIESVKSSKINSKVYSKVK